MSTLSYRYAKTQHQFAITLCSVVYFFRVYNCIQNDGQSKQQKEIHRSQRELSETIIYIKYA